MIEEKDITNPVVKKLNKLSNEPGILGVYWMRNGTFYAAISGNTVFSPGGVDAHLARSCMKVMTAVPVDTEFAVGRIEFSSKTSARLYRVSWDGQETLMVVFMQTGCNFAKSIQRSIRRIFKIKASRTL